MAFRQHGADPLFEVNGVPPSLLIRAGGHLPAAGESTPTCGGDGGSRRRGRCPVRTAARLVAVLKILAPALRRGHPQRLAVRIPGRGRRLGRRHARDAGGGGCRRPDARPAAAQSWRGPRRRDPGAGRARLPAAVRALARAAGQRAARHRAPGALDRAPEPVAGPLAYRRLADPARRGRRRAARRGRVPADDGPGAARDLGDRRRPAGVPAVHDGRPQPVSREPGYWRSPPVTCCSSRYLGAAAAALFRFAAPFFLDQTAADRLATLARTADDLAHRNRLARELHDSIGHTLTASTIQAAAAGRLLDTDPDSARRAMSSIEETSRTALEDLDHVLGVLRDNGGRPAPTMPHAGRSPTSRNCWSRSAAPARISRS